MIRTIVRGRSPFARDQRGHVAIIFAAILIPIMGIVASAVDFGRAAKVRTTLQEAVGSAAQSASAHLFEDRSIIEAQVDAMLGANLPPDLKRLPRRIIIPEDRSYVEVAMQTTVPTTLMAVVGVPQLAVEASGMWRAPVAPSIADGGPTDGPGSVTDPTKTGLVASRTVGKTFDAALPQLPPAIMNQPGMEEAVREVAKQLKGLEAQLGREHVNLPPAAAADLERMMRHLHRHMR